MPALKDLTDIQWVVFDAVGTVLFADPPVHMAYHRIGLKYGAQITPEEALRRFRTSFHQRREDSLATSEARERAFWEALVHDVLPDVPDASGCFAALFEHFARPASWGCYMDVEETFDALRARGLSIALASNFDARLHSVCAGHPPLAGVSTRLISSEVGWKKPSPEFFRALVERCGVAPKQILMVGDDRENDVLAARRAGLQAIHLDRSGKGGDDCLTSLEELLD